MQRAQLVVVLSIAAAVAASVLVLSESVAVWAIPVALTGAALYVCKDVTRPSRAGVRRQLVPWWLPLWCALFLSGLVFRVRDTATILQSPLDAWGVYRAALVAVVAFSLFARLVLNHRTFGPPYPSGPLRWLLLYAGFALLSTAWSVHPLWTFYKSGEYLVDLALAVAICATIVTIDDIKKLFNATWGLVGCLAVAVVVSAMIWPDAALRRDVGLVGIQLSGVFPIIAANAVGDIGAILGCVAVSRLLVGDRSRVWYGALLLTSLALLVLSQSRTPLAGFVAGIGCALVITRRRGWALSATVAAALLLLLTPLGDYVWAFVARGQSPDLILSATGRTKLWSVSWTLFQERPLIGYGAMASTRFLVSNEQPWGDVAYSQADSTYVEVLGGLGILGLIPLLWCLISAWRALHVTRHHPQLMPVITEAMSVLALLTVRSFFTAGSLIWHPSLAFVSVVICADVAARIATAHTTAKRQSEMFQRECA